MAVMDSRNNIRHCLKSERFFPHGLVWQNTDITGVHGTQTVLIGIGTAVFTTTCTDGSEVHWSFPNSVHNPNSPVNLVCMNRFHYADMHDTKTGHSWIPINESMTLKDGRVVPVPKDRASQLPLIEIHPSLPSVSSLPAYDFSDSRKSVLPLMQAHTSLDDPQIVSHFTNTHVPKLNTANVRRILNCPHERVLNTTLQHNMIEGTQHVPTLTSIDRSARPDSWWKG